MFIYLKINWRLILKVSFILTPSSVFNLYSNDNNNNNDMKASAVIVSGGRHFNLTPTLEFSNSTSLWKIRSDMLESWEGVGRG